MSFAKELIKELETANERIASLESQLKKAREEIERLQEALSGGVSLMSDLLTTQRTVHIGYAMQRVEATGDWVTRATEWRDKAEAISGEGARWE